MKTLVTCPACGESNFVFDPPNEGRCPRCQAALPVGGASSVPSPAGRESQERECTRLHTPENDNPYAPPADVPHVTKPSTKRWTDLRRPYELEFQEDTSLPLAPRLARLGGALIDGVFAVGVGAVAILVFGTDDERNLKAIGYLGIGAAMLIQSVLIALRGQSLGKMALGMQIVNQDDDQIPDFIQGVLIRTWLPILLSLIPFFKLIDILCIFNSEQRCVHDMMAGTRVVDISGGYIRL